MLYIHLPNISLLSYFDSKIRGKRTHYLQVDFILECPFFKNRPDPGFQLPVLQLSEGDREFLLDRLLTRETTSYFYLSSPVTVLENPPFLNADRTYLLEDYNRFEDIATTFREYAPEILVRRRDKKNLF